MTMRVVAKATTKRLAVEGSSGATVAPDGETMFIDGDRHGTPGGFVISRAHPRGVFFGTSEVHDARFSPDGKLLFVYNDELDVVSVLGVPDGAVLSDNHHAKVARFDTPSTLLVWSGCQLSRIDPKTGAGAPVGPRICGGADASDDGRTWIVAEPEPHGRPLSRREYHDLTLIDATTGAAKKIMDGVAFGEVRLAPTGDYVCFDARGLRCMQIAKNDARAIEIPRLDVYTLVWDETSPRFVTASFRYDDIEVVDLAARTVRRIDLGDADVRYLGFLPGGKRVYVYDKGAWIIDVDSGRAVEVFPKTVEAGGFVPVPGRDDRFFMGNELGSARNFLSVELPAIF